MRTTLIGAILVALALALPLGAAGDPPRSGIVHVPLVPGETPVEHGYQLYAGNCSTCHGSRGEGITHKRAIRGAGDQAGLGPSLIGVGALAADFYLRTGYMPLERAQAQPRRSRVLFGDRELADLIAYVASLGHGPTIPKPDPGRGNLADGLKLFTDHCAGCHQINAEGGYVTGAFVPPIKSDSPVRIAEAVRTGPYLMPRFSNRQLSDDDLDSIIRYVEHAKHPTDAGGWSLGHIGPVPEGLVTWFVAMVAIVAACVVIGERNRP
jgi:ubiquinol-cytochrome c reductase cytochrome c subunit